MCHVSLNFFVLAEWDELVDLGSVLTRPRTSQVMNNKEPSRQREKNPGSKVAYLCVR